MKAVDIQYCYF